MVFHFHRYSPTQTPALISTLLSHVHLPIVCLLCVTIDLKLDAERDLQDIGCDMPVIALNKESYESLKYDTGVLFVTYSSLTAKSGNGRKSRLRQIISWCNAGGDDLQGGFNGCLLFDESHKAKNSQNSKAGCAVEEIQKKLPNSRVVYCSATGVSEPHHLSCKNYDAVLCFFFTVHNFYFLCLCCRYVSSRSLGQGYFIPGRVTGPGERGGPVGRHDGTSSTSFEEERKLFMSNT